MCFKSLIHNANSHAKKNVAKLTSVSFIIIKINQVKIASTFISYIEGKMEFLTFLIILH